MAEGPHRGHVRTVKRVATVLLLEVFPDGVAHRQAGVRVGNQCAFEPGVERVPAVAAQVGGELLGVDLVSIVDERNLPGLFDHEAREQRVEVVAVDEVRLERDGRPAERQVVEHHEAEMPQLQHAVTATKLFKRIRRMAAQLAPASAKKSPTSRERHAQTTDPMVQHRGRASITSAAAGQAAVWPACLNARLRIRYAADRELLHRLQGRLVTRVELEDANLVSQPASADAIRRTADRAAWRRG